MKEGESRFRQPLNMETPRSSEHEGRFNDFEFVPFEIIILAPNDMTLPEETVIEGEVQDDRATFSTGKKKSQLKTPDLTGVIGVSGLAASTAAALAGFAKISLVSTTPLYPAAALLATALPAAVVLGTVAVGATALSLYLKSRH